MNQSNGENKLLGTLYLDLTQQKNDVNEANRQLSEIGKNIGTDVSKAIGQQLKDAITQLTNQLNNNPAIKEVTKKKRAGTADTSEKEAVASQTKQLQLKKQIFNIEQMMGNATGSQKTELEKALASAKSQLEAHQNEYNLLVRKNAKLEDSLQVRQKLLSISVEEQKQNISKNTTEESFVSNLKEQLSIRQAIYRMEEDALRAGTSETLQENEQYLLLNQSLALKQQEYAQLKENNAALEKGAKVQKMQVANAAEENKHRRTSNQIQKQLNQDAEDHQKTMERVLQITTAFVTMMATQALKKFWTEAVKYSSEYYDQLNQIRIVTGATESEAQKMGDSYRALAEEMKVSSTEIAKAAVEFWRQGLDESYVSERTKYTTQYAKIASLDFQEAAELVTAATNSMDLDAKRVVDVFSYLGDASASGADEIGIAMQKASASAQEAGISFEWLGAYIATVSEKTRQAPEAVGTAFNSMMARIQSIKEKGFNEEDEVKINDVAKALSSVNIELMNQDQEWRNMSDIFMDISLKWGDMDDKARAYLATTIAGTRQKNVFLTLMNDMSKISEATGEASRAFELYYGAVESAGSATEKYAIYQESIAAAQADLKNSLEEIYAELADSGVIKGFYDVLTGIADGFYTAADGAGKFAIAVIGIASAIGAVYLAYRNLLAAGAIKTFVDFFIKGYAVAAFAATAAAILLVSSAIGAVVNAAKKASAPLDYSGYIQSTEDTIDKIRTLRDEYEKLLSIENRNKIQEERMAAIVKTLAGLNNDLSGALTDVNGQYLEGEAALSAMNIALDGYISRLQTLSAQQALANLQDTSGIDLARQEYSKSKGAEAVNNVFDMAKKGSYAEYDYEAIEVISMLSEVYKNGRKNGNWVSGTNILSDGSWQAEILNFWEQQGVLAEDLESFFIDFDGSKQSALNKMKQVEFSSLTKDSDKLKDAAEDWLENYLVKYMNSENYATLSKEAKAAVAQMAEDFVTNLSADDVRGMTNDELEEKAIAYFEDRYATIQKVNKVVSGMLANYNDEEDPDKKRSIGEAANAYIGRANERYGLDISSIETLANEADNATTSLHLLRDAAGEVWEEVEKKNQEDMLAGFSEDKWATHIKWMQRGLEKAMGENGDGGDFLVKIMKKWMGDEKYLKAMMTDLGWFDDFAKAVDTGDFVKANEIMQNGIVATNEEVEKLKESMKELVDGQNLDKLKESGFASWMEEIQEYTQSQDGTGLFQWLVGKDDKARDAFFEMYPLLGEVFNTFVQNEGAVDKGAKEWETLAGMLADANNQYKNWLENKRKENLENVTDKEGYSAASSLLSSYGASSADAVQAFEEANKALSESQRDWLYDNIEGYQELIDKISEGTDATEDYEKAMKDVAKATSKWDVEQLEEYGDVLKDMPDWVESCYGGMAAYSESIAEAESAMNDLVKAQGYINGINNGTITSTEHLKEAYDHLAEVTRYSADDLRNNLAPAQAYLANQSVVTGNMVNYFKNQLQAAGAVDFSTANWRAELAALATQLDTDTGKMASFLQVLLAANEALGNPTTVTVPKYSGGGGSGGSSKDSGKTVSEIEKMLDLMEDIQKIRKHQREIISTTREYFEQEGNLTTAIKYYEDERNAIEENSKVLEDNIDKIEAVMFAKQKEVAAMDTSDEAYEQAAKDLEALQEAHQEYSLELLENKNAISDFNRSIKDMQNEIRDMEIELRETILEAIEDREELNERMLQGTIDVENEILDVITARYEKERDLAIETAEAKIEALERESEILDEQLKKRKEAAEAEDKQAKLAQLNAQLTRISADPTRRKEELELRKQIQELRDEMAWDLAEDEVEAQQESIDQQITSLEDYIEQVEAYYEDLFKHPQKLFEEVKQIMQKTDEEIITWLKQNSEEYAASSEAAQRDIVNGWNEMIMDMHGQIKDYWDEVEEIVTAGDDAIIAFLKENSADYKEAGKLQAEAYVDQWKQQLDSLKRAYEDFHAEVENTKYESVKPSTGSSSSSGSNGSSSGNKPVSSEDKSFYVYNSKGSVWGPYTLSRAKTYASQEADKNPPVYIKDVTGAVASVYSGSRQYSDLKKYARGGLANFTGPAWLDGTPSAPERILSPYQTKLFEDMISTLHQIKITAPTMPASVFDGGTNNSQAISFGDIILNVDQLASDADYAYIVNRLMQEIMERMAQGSAVGGIRVYR